MASHKLPGTEDERQIMTGEMVPRNYLDIDSLGRKLVSKIKKQDSTMKIVINWDRLNGQLDFLKQRINNE